MGKAYLMIILLAIGIAVSGCCCFTGDGSSDSGYSSDDDYTQVPDNTGNDDSNYYPIEPTETAPISHVTSSPAPTYISTAKPTDTATYVNYNNHVVELSDLTASDTSVEETAEAILANDKDAFLRHMSKDTLKHVSGEPDLTSSQAVKLANGLKTARLVKAEPNMMTYEMTIDSTTYTFNTVKEDGAWKLTGL